MGPCVRRDDKTVHAAQTLRNPQCSPAYCWDVRPTGAPERGLCMAVAFSPPTTVPEPIAIPAWLLRVCFTLSIVNVTLLLTAYVSNWWVYDADGRGIPTDFINVWAAGRLVLD